MERYRRNYSATNHYSKAELSSEEFSSAVELAKKINFLDKYNLWRKIELINGTGQGEIVVKVTWNEAEVADVIDFYDEREKEAEIALKELTSGREIV